MAMADQIDNPPPHASWTSMAHPTAPAAYGDPDSDTAFGFSRSALNRLRDTGGTLKSPGMRRMPDPDDPTAGQEYASPSMKRVPD